MPRLSETNGEGMRRLDRIEKMIELQVLANQAAHDQFKQQHKDLLTAQILMADTMNKLEVKMLETGQNLDALIKVAYGVIRRDPPPYRT
jgi:hypothetical protein